VTGLIQGDPPTEPHLLPEWEKFHAKELPKAPDTIDDLPSEPKAPKLE
jgi:hypothetical protein